MPTGRGSGECRRPLASAVVGRGRGRGIAEPVIDYRRGGHGRNVNSAWPRPSKARDGRRRAVVFSRPRLTRPRPGTISHPRSGGAGSVRQGEPLTTGERMRGIAPARMSTRRGDYSPRRWRLGSSSSRQVSLARWRASLARLALRKPPPSWPCPKPCHPGLRGGLARRHRVLRWAGPLPVIVFKERRPDRTVEILPFQPADLALMWQERVPNRVPKLANLTAREPT